MEMSTERFYRVLSPRQAVIVTSGSIENPNGSVVAWSTPVSFDPPLLAISLQPRRYTHELIEKTNMFAVNVPTMDIVQETFYLGTHSGREENKFDSTGLTVRPGHVLEVPIVGECIASIECTVQGALETGDHTLFIGLVENVVADPEYVSPQGIEIRADTIYWRDTSTPKDTYKLVRRETGETP